MLHIIIHASSRKWVKIAPLYLHKQWHEKGFSGVEWFFFTYHNGVSFGGQLLCLRLSCGSIQTLLVYQFRSFLERAVVHCPLAETLNQSGLMTNLTFLNFFSPLTPTVAVAAIWAQHFSNKSVLFWYDNQVVMHFIAQTSKSCVMWLGHQFVLHCRHYNTQLMVSHVPGILNEVVDTVSSSFTGSEPVPVAAVCPNQVPLEYWNLGESEYVRRKRKWDR